MAAGLQSELTTEEISRIFIDKKPLLFKSIKQVIKKFENKKFCKCS
jgi:hypothetical protein